MKIHGIIPPLVTPLHPDGSLDLNATTALLDHVIDGGVHGVFILGTTGEGPNLSYALRRQFIEHVTGAVAGRVSVIVGISDTSMKESLDMADFARRAGADGVAFTPPYYFVPGEAELNGFVQGMAEGLDIPFFLYNMPALTKVSLPQDVVETGFSYPHCLGLKDSSGDLFYFKKIRRQIADRPLSLLIGPEELLAESLLAGGNGGINGGANIFPAPYVKIYDLCQQGDFAAAAEIQREVLEISLQLFTIGRHNSRIIKGIKGALEVLGLAQRHLAAPFRGFEDRELSQVASAVENLRARESLEELINR